MVICCILRTAFTDPGILPRANPEEIQYLEKSSKISINNISSFFNRFLVILGNIQNLATSGRVLEITMVTGHVLRLKFCQTCKLFRPPRASHCSICDACIGKLI